LFPGTARPAELVDPGQHRQRHLWNNPGVTQGGTSFAPGKVGQAFHFDGVDNAVSVASPQSINGLRKNLTVMAWFQYEGFGNYVAAKISSKRVPGGFAPFEINIRNEGVCSALGVESNSRYYFALLSNEEQVRLHRGHQ
jgi:hypothetical protein